MSDQQIFISFASSDRPFIDKIIRELKTQGIVGSTDEILRWDETTFVPGSSVRGALRTAIESATKVILVWSGAAANSPGVNYEAGMADALGKPIVVVVPKGEQSRVPADLAGSRVVPIEMEGGGI